MSTWSRSFAFYVSLSRRAIDIYPVKTVASALGSGREGTLGAPVFEWVYIIRSILSRAYIVRLIRAAKNLSVSSNIIGALFKLKAVPQICEVALFLHKLFGAFVSLLVLTMQ